MARTIPATYLAAHHWLRQLRTDDVGNFADVSERDQLALHTYFCPDKDRTDKQLLEHRRIVSNRDPSLPQRAGRALQRFRRAQAAEVVYTPPVHVTPGHGRQGDHALTVRAVIKPEPDLDRLVRAIMLVAEEQAKRERDQAA